MPSCPVTTRPHPCPEPQLSIAQRHSPGPSAALPSLSTRTPATASGRFIRRRGTQARLVPARRWRCHGAGHRYRLRDGRCGTAWRGSVTPTTSTTQRLRRNAATLAKLQVSAPLAGTLAGSDSAPNDRRTSVVTGRAVATTT